MFNSYQNNQHSFFSLDKKISPAEDFYLFVNNNWKKSNPISQDQSQWSTIHELRDQSKEDVKNILLEVKIKPKNEEEKILGKFFNTAMDTKKIKENSFKNLNKHLNRIKNLQTKEDFTKEIAYQHLVLSSPFFSFGVSADLEDSDKNLLEFWQNGLALPEKSYYEDQEKESIRKKYVEHIKNIFKLAEFKDYEKKANNVYKLEKLIAKNSKNSEEIRDVKANFNRFSITELLKKYPNFLWNIYFKTLKINSLQELSVGQIEYFKFIDDYFVAENFETIRDYLLWNFLYKASPFLSEEFVKENFNFNDKILSGKEKIEPREKRITDLINRYLGDLVGKIYVKKHFSPESKEKAMILIKNIIKSVDIHIKELDWMEEKTKQTALKKLKSIKTKIAYPDQWKDYSNLKLTDNFLENVLAVIENESNYLINKLQKPVDRDEWHMNPQTVNAYYNPSNNEIVFPTAILQKPFFDKNADNALNYGGIGVVIGHEITHAFDDRGSLFDEKGNLNQWWTEKDLENFKSKSKDLITDFDKLTIQTGENNNGKLTLSENIADLGGVGVAYTAFLLTNPSEEKIEGFTPKQRFFMNFTQIWRNNIRDKQASKLIKTDPHSPMKHRVLGTLANFSPFYEVFSLDEKFSHYKKKEDRIKIW
jgi:predicted metalloendopeptidase